MSDPVTLCRRRCWPDESLHGALAGLPDEALRAPRPIIFGSIARTLAHGLDMDRVWRAHRLGRTHDVRNRVAAAEPDVDLLHTRQAERDAWYVDHAGRADRA